MRRIRIDLTPLGDALASLGRLRAQRLRILARTNPRAAALELRRLLTRRKPRLHARGVHSVPARVLG